MVKQVWQASDRSVHETKADAENHDLIVQVAAMIYDAYITHGATKEGFKHTTQDETMRVADILINTDVFGDLRDVLSDINASAEFKQLRRIDKAARAWYNARSPQALDDLSEALFNGC